MPKGGKSSRKRGGGDSWTASDHLAREQVKLAKKNQKQYDRSKLLAHDTQEKRDDKKLELQILRTKRRVEEIKARLMNWDDVEEERLRAKEEQERKEQEAADDEEEQQQTSPSTSSSQPDDVHLSYKRRRLRNNGPRPGPETWKLRGAARPAEEVYDFDVRHVDPHLKAHADALAKTKRSRNLLILYKQNFASPSLPPLCREYMATLMQLALLYLHHASKVKSARKVLLHIVNDLESPLTGHITTAKCRLMRLYMNAKRWDSAQRFHERLHLSNTNNDDSNTTVVVDKSVWVRYSAVLMKFQQQQQQGDEMDQLIRQAIQTNPYCALYLAFWDTFNSSNVMEYVEEIEDATEEEPLEEAIEYCNSEQVQLWSKTLSSHDETTSALTWWQGIVLDIYNRRNAESTNDSDTLTRRDLEWNSRLEKMEELAAKQQHADDDDDDEDVVDVVMFAGMFRTAMEIVEDKYNLNHQAEQEED